MNVQTTIVASLSGSQAIESTSVSKTTKSTPIGQHVGNAKTNENNGQQTFGELIKQYEPQPLKKLEKQSQNSSHSSEDANASHAPKGSRSSKHPGHVRNDAIVGTAGATSLVNVELHPKETQNKLTHAKLSQLHSPINQSLPANVNGNGHVPHIEDGVTPRNGNITETITGVNERQILANSPLVDAPTAQNKTVKGNQNPNGSEYPGSTNESSQSHGLVQSTTAENQSTVNVIDSKGLQAHENGGSSPTLNKGYTREITAKSPLFQEPQSTREGAAGARAQSYNTSRENGQAMLGTISTAAQTGHKAVTVGRPFRDLGKKTSVPTNTRTAGVAGADATTASVNAHGANEISNLGNTARSGPTQATNAIDLAQAITSHIKGVDGTYSIDIAMYPSELGEVRAQVSLKGDSLNVVLIPHTPLGQHALSTTLADVKSQLAQNGMEVHVTLQNHQNSEQEKQAASQSHGEENAGVQISQELAQASFSTSGRVHVIM